MNKWERKLNAEGLNMKKGQSVGKNLIYMDPKELEGVANKQQLKSKNYFIAGLKMISNCEEE